MLSRQQQTTARGDDREQITTARQAAEALFTPKPVTPKPVTPKPVTPKPVSPRAGPESLTPTVRPSRKPRVLPILSPAAAHYEEREPPAAPAPQTMREIPRAQFGRIRTLVKYGMTAAQVAEVYGVAADAIAGILRAA